MLKPGDRLPDVTFTLMGEGGPIQKTTTELFGDKLVILIGVPGAFTPTCHGNHLPGYLARYEALKDKSIDAVMLTSVNDVFVMDAWAESSQAKGKIEFLADGSAVFANAIGLSLDLTEKGLGIRSQRYSMLVDDGIVKHLHVEPLAAKVGVSGADEMLITLS